MTPLKPPLKNLKPCPFCGKKARMVDLGEPCTNRWVVYCCDENCCRTLGQSRPTKDEAENFWNTRPSPQVEGLVAALTRAEKVSGLMERMHFENGDVMSPEAQLGVASALHAEIVEALHLYHSTVTPAGEVKL